MSRVSALYRGGLSRRRRIVGLALIVLIMGAMVVQRVNDQPAMHTVLDGTYPSVVAVDQQSGRAFIGAVDHDEVSPRLWMLTSSDGRPVSLHLPASCGLPAGLGVDSQRSRVFLAPAAGATGCVLDARNGALLATVSMSNTFLGTGFMVGGLCVSERTGHVFVGIFDVDANNDQMRSAISVFDANTGRVVQSTPVGRGLDTLAIDERTGRVFGVNVLSDDVSVLDARSGVLLATTLVSPHPLAIAVDERTDHVFVTSNAIPAGGPGGWTGQVDMLDARTGALIYTAHVGVLPYAIATDARSGRVFVANSGSDSVSVLDARSGRVLRTVAVGRDPAAIAVDARAGRVFVANLNGSFPLVPQQDLLGPGSVAVLDARDGAVVHMVAVGVDPAVMRVDERTGRVFVLNKGGEVPVLDRWGWVPGWLRSNVPFLPQHTAQTRRIPGSVSVLDLSS